MERLDCLLKVVRWIRKYYGKAVSIRINTNGHGYLLNRGREVIKELKAAGVDKISVSLNAHSKQIHDRVCRPRFGDAYESARESIEKAKGNFDVEVTAVAIPEVNLAEVRNLAQKIGVNFRIREYIPCLL
jgi:TatD family-associated radical SAM protein